MFSLLFKTLGIIFTIVIFILMVSAIIDAPMTGFNFIWGY